MGRSSAVWSHDIRYSLCQDIRYTLNWVKFQAEEAWNQCRGRGRMWTSKE